MASIKVTMITCTPWSPREAGVSPALPRNCERGRNLRQSHWSYGWEGAGSRTIRKPGNLIQASATTSFRGKGVCFMWRRFSVLSTFIPLLGLTLMADAVYAAKTP